MKTKAVGSCRAADHIFNSYYVKLTLGAEASQK